MTLTYKIELKTTISKVYEIKAESLAEALLITEHEKALDLLESDDANISTEATEYTD